MAITRWEPISDMMTLRQAFDRLFEDAWVRPGGLLLSGDTGLGTLPLDIHEKDDELVVTASMPGVRPEDIDITIQGDILRIQGEMKHEEEVKEEQYHRRERRFGRFHREVALPMNVKADGAQARFEDGILRLHLPKAEEAKARRIQIQGAVSPQLKSQAA